MTLVIMLIEYQPSYTDGVTMVRTMHNELLLNRPLNFSLFAQVSVQF